jgi:Homeodomain-like domain
MDWKHVLAYITGPVDQELLLRNEYLVTENRLLRHQSKGRVRLSDGERKTLAEIGQKLGRQTLKEVATIVKPGTILGWHRKLVAQKFDGSQQREAPGRPMIDQEVEDLVVRMAQEDRSWGYDRIVGALANLGYTLSDQTVGNILKRHGVPPAPERKTTTTWKEFPRNKNAALPVRAQRSPLDQQRPEKKWVPDGAFGHEPSRPKRVSWLPAYGMM